MKIIINQENYGQRVDKFLSQGAFLDAQITRGEIIRRIKNGEVLVNNKKTKPSYVLKEKDEVEIELEKKEEKILPNEKIKLEIIYQDKNIIVINKPAGLKVHPVNFEENNSLVNALLFKFPEIENVGEDKFRPGIVHRLDKDTSGIIVIARKQKIFEELKNKFQSREMEKKYLAIICGHLEKKEGKIEAPIARAMSIKKQKVAEGKIRGKIRPAVTLYKVIKKLKDFDLVEVFPKTGRMHQIRVHLSYLGHPVAGDQKYARKEFRNLSQAGRQMLHASEIKFNLNGRDYLFKASEPADFKAFLNHTVLTKSQ